MPRIGTITLFYMALGGGDFLRLDGCSDHFGGRVFEG
jgi:hypothetical protein